MAEALMFDNDLDLFHQEMKGVKPLRNTKKTRPTRSSQVAEPALLHRRQMAVQFQQADDSLTEEIIDLVHPLDILEFRTNGVSHGVFRKLKQGKYPVDGRLDLHRRTLKEARIEVQGFIKDCLRYDVRSAMIVHGKGIDSQPQAFLKSCVNSWLRQMSAVLAFHSAQKHHGGVGALYVLLRKSEPKKQENRQYYRR